MLKVLEGTGKRLELHADHIVIQRTDMLASVAPEGFSEKVEIPFAEIIHVRLHQPEPLRLKEDEGNDLRFVITRRDHSTVSLKLRHKHLKAAQEMRAAIESHITALAKPG